MKMRRPLLVLIFSLFLLNLTVGVTMARQNILIGGLTVSTDYYKRSSDSSSTRQTTSQDTQNLRKIKIAPLFIFSSKTGRDSIEVSVVPSLSYDFETKEYDTLDQNFSLDAYRYITRHWQVGASNTFVRSDDPTLVTYNQDTLTQDYGRRRYWTNQAELYTSYEYGRERNWRLGYQLDYLRNDDTGPGGYEDHDRHDLNFELNHRFNTFWSFSLNSHYIRGLFDPPDDDILNALPADSVASQPITIPDDFNDITEYRAIATVTSTTSASKSQFLTYSYVGSRFDAALRDNSDLHELTLGGQYQLTPRTNIGFGCGPSYEKTESFSGRWGANGHIDHSYAFKKGSIKTTVEKGYDQQNFSGTSERGIIEFWRINSTMDYSFTAKLTGNISLSYRDTNQEDLVFGIREGIDSGVAPEFENREDFRELSAYNQETYTGKAGLSYIFWTWYTARIDYTYSRHYSERYSDYKEHRLFSSISVKKEILRW